MPSVQYLSPLVDAEGVTNRQTSPQPTLTAYRTDQILQAEEIALARYGQKALMQRAAMAVSGAALRVVKKRNGVIPGGRVALLVGGGNNGGDALIAGALLRRRGIAVTAILLNPENTHSRGLQTLRLAGGRAIAADRPEVLTVVQGADVIIDGVVGIGATPPLRPDAATLIETANAATGFKIAVDLPSGIDPNTGHHHGAVFRADLTVTMGAAKTGILVAEHSGRIKIVPIGLDLTQAPDAVSFGTANTRLPTPASADNKFTTGVVGIAAGSPGYPGAAVLAVGAAVRTRPGLVRYAGSQVAPVLARWPEVVAANSVTGSGRVQAWVVGPGLGTDEEALQTMIAVLTAQAPVLVDADGLTMLADHRNLLAERAERGGQTLLTPHAGEFARVFPEFSATDRLVNARSAASASGATVLLKGSRTIVTDGVRTAVNLTGSGWLATAGSGDVLAGLIGSLLATGLDTFEAASLGAHLHGRAGERAQSSEDAGAQELWARIRSG